MIDQIYQLIAPKVISIKHTSISFADKMIIRPEMMAICHADQRYFMGKRDAQTLQKKLPMALIHECCGRVLYDPSGTLQPGQKVIMIPNIPAREDPIIFENYAEGSYFLSSGHDGFMRELVDIAPDRVVTYEHIPSEIAAICEFVSVAVHAATRFDRIAHSIRNRIGIWGDGSLAYTVACVMHKLFPNSELVVVGHQSRKLAHFSFVKETYLSDNVPADLKIDHVFECCGGEGSYYAIEDTIAHIRPQGTLMLMGVSENRVAINTRMVMEKGMTLVGVSRSGRSDFLKAVELMEQPDFQQLLQRIVFFDGTVRTIEDIFRVFADDLSTPFKTVFKWEM